LSGISLSAVGRVDRLCFLARASLVVSKYLRLILTANGSSSYTRTLNHDFLICKRLMVSWGGLHGVHSLATRTDVPSAQLRLLVHATGGNGSAGSTGPALELLVAAALEVLADVKRRRPYASIPI